MNTVHCFRLLGLSSNAGLEEIKASYRRLARQYHPDFNQGNQQAQSHFIRLTEAYQFLKDIFPDPNPVNSYATGEVKVKSSQSPQGSQSQAKPPQPPKKSPTQQPFAQVNHPQQGNLDQQLKWRCYEKLREVMKEKRFARAIAIVEGLSYALPSDAEIRQWQAIVYQHKARQLLQERRLEQARRYFDKALRTDPYNRLLRVEIEKDWGEIVKPTNYPK
jgi:curved DNA-binding protein CbpA